MSLPADPRLVLSEPELDAALESLLMAETSLWMVADAALASQEPKLGRGHWRCAFLLRRRPGLGVQALAQLVGVTKQSMSRTVKELTAAGLIELQPAEDGRRREARLTPSGLAFEAACGERMRASLARAYRTGGVEAATGARRIWSALAGGRGAHPKHRSPDLD
ncbi:MarR family transcriptional regulator [soil metagenome]